MSLHQVMASRLIKILDISMAHLMLPHPTEVELQYVYLFMRISVCLNIFNNFNLL